MIFSRQNVRAAELITPVQPISIPAVGSFWVALSDYHIALRGWRSPTPKADASTVEAGLDALNDATWKLLQAEVTSSFEALALLETLNYRRHLVPGRSADPEDTTTLNKAIDEALVRSVRIVMAVSET